MAEDHSLPGWPKKKLVRDVRRHLSHYGIRPSQFSIWQATWSWASAIANSYWHTHWPLPSEIASQYILLLLAEMQQSHQLKLPYRAKKVIPPEVRALLPAQQPALLAIADGRGKDGKDRKDTTRTAVDHE
ncbi:MAG: hypothetical protein GXX96_35800 [Planctomycetaceae bacterium]|nr:hypothetical protein [Planctomycetaceae bacterium]